MGLGTNVRATTVLALALAGWVIGCGAADRAGRRADAQVLPDGGDATATAAIDAAFDLPPPDAVVDPGPGDATASRPPDARAADSAPPPQPIDAPADRAADGPPGAPDAPTDSPPPMDSARGMDGSVDTRPPTDARAAPDLPPQPGGVAQLGVGFSHSCVLLATGAVRCWGQAVFGMTGHASTASIGDDEYPSAAPAVNVGGNVMALSVGELGTCVLLAAGNVRCWGSGYAGRNGYGNTTTIGDEEAPATAGDIDVGGKVVRIVQGRNHVCALLAAGNVRCWGSSSYGQLGYGKLDTIGDDELPAAAGDVPVGGPVARLAAGWYHTCAVLTTGKLRCWGQGWAGALGHGNLDNIGDDETAASAGDVDVGAPVADVAAGFGNTCAILTSGKLRCWGDGDRGQLGKGTQDLGDDEPPSAAGDVDVGGPVVQVGMGQGFTCARLQSGSVRCWGSAGFLGYADWKQIGDDEPPASAGDVPVGAKVAQLSVGSNHTCVLLETGNVRCWGWGADGRLGYGRTDFIGDDETPASAGDVPIF